MRQFIYFILLFCFVFTSIHAQKKQVHNRNKQTVNQSERILKRKVAIAQFINETQSSKGLLNDKENDVLSKLAVDILSSKLAATNKFILLERSNLSKLINESEKLGKPSQYIGAEYLIFGSITTFGNRSIGDTPIYSPIKSQSVEATISIRLVDVSTGLIIYSGESKGIARLKSKQILGIGGRFDYDAALTDKAISIAITKLVNNITSNCMDRPWKAYFLAYDSDGIFISGGKSQGIKVGDKYIVKQRRKSIRNPQDGLHVELPGQSIGEIKVLSVGGSGPQNEFSTVAFVKGDIDKAKIAEYYIEEKM